MSTSDSAKAAIEAGERFAFGSNWRRFLALVDEERIKEAEQSLRVMCGVARLDGKRFLDIGSGSGLFSLAAGRLGAEVVSFDYDAESVACTEELKRRYFPGDSRWRIEKGSALDRTYMYTLGTFDVVYSWGVLHHTGAMWEALDYVSQLVAGDGLLCLAIYNDQGRFSRWWTRLKRFYNATPSALRPLIVGPMLVRFWARRFIKDTMAGHPTRSWREYEKRRGMSAWHDVVDWVGGYPFEVARPDQIFAFYRQRGFELTHLLTCGGGHGCNQYVFRKRAEGAR